MEEKTRSQGHGPLKRLSVGNISVTVWLNETSEGKKYHTCNVQRYYKDKDGQDKYTSTLRQQDWLIAAELLKRAFSDVGIQIVS